MTSGYKSQAQLEYEREKKKKENEHTPVPTGKKIISHLSPFSFIPFRKKMSKSFVKRLWIFFELLYPSKN